MTTRQEIVDTIMNEWESEAMCPRREFWGDCSITIADVKISNPQAILRYQRFKLEQRLPDVDAFKTCEDFKHLNARCCDSCHGTYELYEMQVVLLPEGGYAWVCCAIERAIHPERHAEWERQFVQGHSKTVQGRKILEMLGYSKTASGWAKSREDRREDPQEIVDRPRHESGRIQWWNWIIFHWKT